MGNVTDAPGGMRSPAIHVMTTTEPTLSALVAVVHGVYAAFSRGDMGAKLELIHRDVDWSIQVHAPGAELVPMFRNGIGCDAVRRHFSGVAGRVDRDAVAAVIAVAGGAPVHRLAWPAGLKRSRGRRVRLIAVGASNKDIARALGITAKTVALHAAHCYDKRGCRSRAGTALFAIEHGLVGPGTERIG
jgi:DNA-binding CsgD family transcriptional regulator